MKKVAFPLQTGEEKGEEGEKGWREATGK